MMYAFVSKRSLSKLAWDPVRHTELLWAAKCWNTDQADVIFFQVPLAAFHSQYLQGRCTSFQQFQDHVSFRKVV